MSALGRIIAEIIASDGPMPLSRYMALALGHPTFGYYTTRDPLGRAGDFTTAPEISQMFGEMLGLWSAQVWSDMGAPRRVRLVELGPGRGTLIADLIRAARVLPSFREALDIRLVETSPTLRDRQAEAVVGAGVPVTWHDSLDGVPEGPTILLANEFLDALPIRQFERKDGVWRERLVGIGPDGGLALGLAAGPAEAGLVPGRFSTAPEGAVFEASPARETIVAALAARLVRQPGGALLVDYGHARSGLGDTFQAVARHAYADPFADPGTVDLTSHVDFEAIAATARHVGADVHGPIGQGAFLRRLGIETRAQRLGEGKDEAMRAEIAGALERLVAPDAMGQLFQAMALASPGLPAPPPFA
jgi:NADH dehydrogenase [ubiquinone] 1 alpha subcomplex assembly factor 7